MRNLNLKISRIKNITEMELVLPIEKGIYCLVGENGCGKSTIMSCLAQSIFDSSLDRLTDKDFTESSYIVLEFNDMNNKWFYDKKNKCWSCREEQKIKFNGMYEGSLFYGFRFNDSSVVDMLLEKGKIHQNDIVDADEYIKEKLSFILHGDPKSHYSNLKRIRNKKIAENVKLKNTPYFQDFESGLISQYRMSSGECLLISLLHFIYNALIRRSLPIKEPILMLIDEIELALHPVAIYRFLDLLENIIKEHDNLVVILTSHSPEVINKIKPNNLFMIEMPINNLVSVTNPCYPCYAIRNIYVNDGFDYIVLVEDILAKYLVEYFLQNMDLRISKLINVVPVGGWKNVLTFQDEANRNAIFGTKTKIFSILDGDIQNNVDETFKNLTKVFIPVNSIEKFLLNILIVSPKLSIKKAINDKYFFVKSLDSILSEYKTEKLNKKDNNGKILYKKLLTDLENRKISEDIFIRNLCEIICNSKEVNFDTFKENLNKILN